MILWELFLSFLQVGLLSIGGGLAALPIIQNQVVTTHNWLTLSEFTNLVTIAEMTPGPIAINSATFVGTQIAGTLGAVVATLGSVLPSFIIVSVLGFLYTKYKSLSVMKHILACLKPAIIALIASACLTILSKAITLDGQVLTLYTLDYVSIGIFACALFCLLKFKINPIIVMLSAGVVGTVLYLIFM